MGVTSPWLPDPAPRKRLPPDPLEERILNLSAEAAAQRAAARGTSRADAAM